MQGMYDSIEADLLLFTHTKYLKKYPRLLIISCNDYACIIMTYSVLIMTIILYL